MLKLTQELFGAEDPDIGRVTEDASVFEVVLDFVNYFDALAALLRDKDSRPADAYSETALRRVWRCTHFSWWMTTMLHRAGDDFDAQLQLSQLRWVVSSTAGATGLAENYAGLPIGY